jgi:glycerophosphoryl diester phosphodiesterase
LDAVIWPSTILVGDTFSAAEGAGVPIELRAPVGRPYVVGHRGAMGHAPENTLASFRKGVELGAPLLELDVHLSADGRLVVIHDETVDRTTDGAGRVRDLTVDEIRRLDAGSWFGPDFAGEPVPLLDEVLAWARGRAGLVIELKLGPVWYAGIEQALVTALERQAAEAEVLVISFDHFAVRRVKQLAPAVKTAIMYAGRPLDPVGMARAAGADAVRPDQYTVTGEDVAACHAAGLAVIPWTVNDAASMRRMVELGVDGMSSNYPELLAGCIRPVEAG